MNTLLFFTSFLSFNFLKVLREIIAEESLQELSMLLGDGGNLLHGYFHMI